MQVDTIGRAVGTLPAGGCRTPRHGPTLTTSEFLQLGLFRVAYLTQVTSGDGVNIVVHGADGMAVAVVDTAELAIDLTDQLGLALVAVH